MVPKKVKYALFFVVWAVAVTVVSFPAYATFILELEQTSIGGTGPVTIPDGSGLDSNPVIGAITFIGVVDGFTINVTTGLSKPVLSSAPGKIDLNSIDLSGAAGTLEIRLSDTDFPTLVPNAALMMAAGGTTNGKVSLTSIFDPDNNPFGTGGSTTKVSLGPFDPGAFSGTIVAPIVTRGEPFSITQIATIKHKGGTKMTSFDAETTITPEPGSVAAMVGIALLGLVGYVWRRRT